MRIRRHVLIIVTVLLAALGASLLSPTAASADAGYGKLAKGSKQYTQVYDSIINTGTREATIAYLLTTAGGEFRPYAETLARKAAAGDQRCGKPVYLDTLRMVNEIERKKQWGDTYAKFYEYAFKALGYGFGSKALKKTGATMDQIVKQSTKAGNGLYLKAQSRVIVSTYMASGCI